MIKINESDFTYTAADRTRWQALTTAQKKTVLTTAWPELLSLSDSRKTEFVAALVNGMCGHKIERIKRAMDSLGF